MASSASGLCSTPSSPVRLADLLSAVTEHVESLKTTNPSSDRLLTDEGHLAKLRAFAFPLLAENPDAELPLEELAALVGDHAFAPNRQPLYPPITRKLSDEDEPKKRPTLVNKSSTDDFAARTRTVPVLKTSISASRIGAQVKRRSRGPSGSLASGFIPNLHDGQSQNSNAALAAPRTTANSTSLPSPPLTPDLDKQLRQPAISQRASISDTAVAAPQPSNPTSPPSLIPLRLDSSASSTSGTGDEADKLRACMIDVTKRLYDAEKRLSVSQEQSESRIAALQERIKIWQNDVASTKRQLADLRAVEKAQVAQIETMESSAWKLARELEEKRSECQALRSLLEEKESYELKLVAELRRKEDESATKESSLKLLESEIRRFITENGRLEARMAALKSHVDSSESLMSRIISKSSEAVVSTDAADGESFASTASMTTLVSSFSLALDPVPSPHCAPIHRRDDSDDSGFPGFGASSYGTHTNNENDRFDFRPSTPTRQSPVERSLKDIESVIDMFEREIHEARETAKEAQKELSVMSLKEQELSELVSSLQNELIWYREEAEAESAADVEVTDEEMSLPEKRTAPTATTYSSSESARTLSPSRRSAQKSSSTATASLFSLHSALVRLPRWAIPFFLYSVLVWNSGAVFGPISFPDALFSAFAKAPTSPTSNAHPGVMGGGSSGTELILASAGAAACDSEGVPAWVGKVCSS